MKVTLAGATLDRRFWPDDPAATPETVSAAYARVSHSPKGLSRLRDEAVSAIEKARRSNESIVYRMGHSSIAEHAVFNIDVEDCSRLLVEFIEGHRLASFTERSQRYVFFGNKVPVMPKELAGTDPGERLADLDRERFELYRWISSKEDLIDKYGDKLLEEARYVLGLSCPTDIGMTVNAREAEYIVAKGSSHPLDEIRTFSGELLSVTGGLAPSLIKYTGGGSYHYKAMDGVRRAIGEMDRAEEQETDRGGVCSELPSNCDDPESEILAALLFEFTGRTLCQCRNMARDLTDQEMVRILRPIFEEYPVHASLPRAFEMMDMVFDFEISASGFAQLKRHRMATLIVQPYRADSWEVPPLMLEDPDIAKTYIDLMRRAKDLHSEVASVAGEGVAQYCLCNANRRRVILKLNLRELYHFVRLRSDVHAQTEIRGISNSMMDEMRSRYPVVTSLLCGKDGFGEEKKRILPCETI